MKIYIVRHGETDLNSKGVMQGVLDVPLNQSGRDLAAVTGRAIRDIHFDCCISSPLNRAVETAEILLRESGNSVPLIIDDRIMEINCGAYEGRKLSEMGEDSTLYFTDPFRFPGFPNGETIQDLCHRTQAFLKELITRDDGKTYLVSTHGCAMRAMVNYLNDRPGEFWFGAIPYNCSMTIIEAENGRPHIIEVNRVYYDLNLTENPLKKYMPEQKQAD